uniref:Retinoic acid receptor responder 3-like n=1 Tax=Acanthochromis polyacanthus TaxID=80966 RepID=A0A3Q1F9P4_9TELE
MAPTLFDSEPKPGDLIEIFRGTYKHWAIYIGGHEVVHLIPPTNPAADLGPIGDLLTLFDSSTATVRRQKISDVVGSSRFQINNLLDDTHRPREPHVIVTAACRMVGRELPYNAATYNCEHFVTELRYGEAESRQVSGTKMFLYNETKNKKYVLLGKSDCDVKTRELVLKNRKICVRRMAAKVSNRKHGFMFTIGPRLLS